MFHCDFYTYPLTQCTHAQHAIARGQKALVFRHQLVRLICSDISALLLLALATQLLFLELYCSSLWVA